MTELKEPEIALNNSAKYTKILKNNSDSCRVKQTNGETTNGRLPHFTTV